MQDYLLLKMAAPTDSQESVHYKKVSSKVIPGILCPHNKGSVSWGWQGLVAYGCQNVVVVVDPCSVQILQTLEKHTNFVTKVKWANENYYHNQIFAYRLRLASTDLSGNIIVWDVKEGKVLCQLSDGNKPVLDIQWLSSSLIDGAHELLAALHPPYSFVIWNTQTGTKLWKKTYTESLLAFSFDPFCVTNMAFLGADCILMVEDFSLNKVPSSNGRKFYVSSPSNVSGNTSGVAGVEGSTLHADDKSKARERLKRKVRLLAGSDSKLSRSEENSAIAECLGFSYHPACRHHLLLMYSREVLVLDLEINQTVGVIIVEKNCSSFIQVVPCSQRDALCCLHENGIVSLHVRQKSSVAARASLSDLSPDNYGEILYDTKAQSDPIRLTKMNRVMGICVCPQSETRMAVLVSDGKMLILDLKPRHQDFLPAMNTLSDYFAPVYGLPNAKSSLFKFILCGVLPCAASPPLVVRMCPPLTTKNWNIYQPWMAAGTTSGVVQIFDMASGMLYKELSVHTYPIRGIEWVSLTTFLSYGHQNVGNGSGHVKNELYLTDVQTGNSKMFRTENQEESPIDMIRVSHLKQYFILAFKEDPFELWDVRTLTLLRAMSRHFPTITALEWAPVHNLKSIKRKMAQMTDSPSISTTESIDSAMVPPATESKAVAHSLSPLPLKESFVFVDTDGHIYQFYVEGSLIKDGSKLPPENGIGSITSISWKGEQLIMGDVDGNLSFWDLKAKFFKVVPTHRGWIKRVRFAPGRGNLKLLILYSDGVDVWDAKDLKLYGHLKSPRDMPKVEDADWAASDKPVVVTGDGCVKIMDLQLIGTLSPMTERECFAPVWCSALLPSSASVRSVLFHTQSFDCSMDLGERFTGDQKEIIKSHLGVLDRDFKYVHGDGCPLSVVHHCLLVARLLGDEAEVRFWQVAQHYFKVELKERVKDQNLLKDCVHCEAFHIDGSYDMLCDTETFKTAQLDRLALHESKQTNHEHSQKCADKLILLQETDRAIQHLLETDPGTEGYYVDCLRACIVASVQSSRLSQSTVKLVATNLIANGYITEGVQLLCLIGKELDACRYLQTYGKWESAMWLAKCRLTGSDCLEVTKRYLDHLISPQVDQKSNAILVMLSMRQFSKVLEMLLSFSFVDRAAVFAAICEDLKVLPDSDDIRQLLNDVYLKYARFLWNEGHRELALTYAERSGTSEEFVGKDPPNHSN